MSSYLAFKSLIASYSKKSEFIALHLALSQMARVAERERVKEERRNFIQAAAYLPPSPCRPPVSGSVCGSALVPVTLRHSALGIDTE